MGRGSGPTSKTIQKGDLGMKPISAYWALLVGLLSVAGQVVTYYLRFGKGAIRYSKPERIDFGVVESMLRASAKSEGPVC
jgi:hypothetical protein